MGGEDWIAGAVVGIVTLDVTGVRLEDVRWVVGDLGVEWDVLTIVTLGLGISIWD